MGLRKLALMGAADRGGRHRHIGRGARHRGAVHSLVHQSHRPLRAQRHPVRQRLRRHVKMLNERDRGINGVRAPSRNSRPPTRPTAASNATTHQAARHHRRRVVPLSTGITFALIRQPPGDNIPDADPAATAAPTRATAACSPGTSRCSGPTGRGPHLIQYLPERRAGSTTPRQEVRAGLSRLALGREPIALLEQRAELTASSSSAAGDPARRRAEATWL